MTGGYAGKILRVNLTDGKVGTIPTSKYEEFGGGYGIGAAIFWDLCAAPGGWDLQDAFDPRNIVTLMSGPLAGKSLERLKSTRSFWFGWKDFYPATAVYGIDP